MSTLRTGYSNIHAFFAFSRPAWSGWMELCSAKASAFSSKHSDPHLGITATVL